MEGQGIGHLKVYSGRYENHWSEVLVFDPATGKRTPLEPCPASGLRTLFDWGYGYKGPNSPLAPAPVQLSYALLNDACGLAAALEHHRAFLIACVMELPAEKEWTLTEADILAIVNTF